MNIGIFARLMFGYVRIEVEGYYIEQFINMCKEQKILIWNLKKEKGIKLYLNVGIRDFKSLSGICKKTRCKVRIQKKKGIPFVLYRYKKRKIFAFFLILLLISIIVSSNYVWNIDVNIEEGETMENVVEDLEGLGLKKGINKREIDANKIITEMRLKRNDISWMGMDIKGTNVIVKIVKVHERPEIIDNSEYCNIVAKKGGVITKIVAQNGTALVNVGDTVKKGDIVIQGIIEGKYTEPRKVHSLRGGRGENKIYR